MASSAFTTSSDRMSPAEAAISRPEGQAVSSTVEPSRVRSPVEEDTTIEAEDHDSAVDPAEFEPVAGWDGASNASTSVTSSIYAHEYEHGRRFHSYKHGRYPVPNDDQEQSREDMKHAMVMELTDGTLFYSPVGDNPQKIIDIGTGTGIWAIEVGDRYPGAQVVGIDLSPIQPSWVPPNVSFYVDDAEDEWANGSNFDLVHFRTMASILKNLQKVMDQAFLNIKPGGWIEFQELYAVVECDDGTMAEDDPLKVFYELSFKAFRTFGFDPGRVGNLTPMLEQAGFTNVTKVVKKVPIGAWARDKTLRLCGHYMRLAILEIIPSFAGRPFQNLGLNEVESQMWLQTARKALDDMSVHRHFSFYFWSAQKPE